VDFSSGFLGLAVSLVAVTVGFAGAFLTRRVGDYGVGCLVVSS